MCNVNRVQLPLVGVDRGGTECGRNHQLMVITTRHDEGMISFSFHFSVCRTGVVKMAEVGQVTCSLANMFRHPNGCGGTG